MTRKNISEAISNISDRHVEEVMSFREKCEGVNVAKGVFLKRRNKTAKNHKYEKG